MFTVQEVDNYQVKTETVGECDQNCLDAKDLKCVCKCHGKNHGAALRQNVKPLDEFEEDRGEDPAEPFEDPVEATFGPDEYLQELAVLA